MLWNKLDSSLGSRYGAYLRAGVDARLLVSLMYEGDLEAIEAAGFHTAYRGGPEGYATGEILLSELEQIASAPGVVRISFGQRTRPTLDQSVPQINARPDIWDWDAAQSKFVAVTGKGTGKGVIVGVIDTGIDWQHAYFKKDDPPLKTTRIRAIWDQGLRPDSDDPAGPPAASLLTGHAGAGVTYGIEYQFARIQAAVHGGPSLRHRDCDGHGTHVASIAAGDGGPDRTFIGVAPEADLIVVKYLRLQHEPRANNYPAGAEIGPDVAFRDAVHYILEKAKPLGMPVVINASLGSPFGPHDGYTSSEDWLTKTFDARPGACFVTAAGNSAGDEQHAVINFTGAGTITLDVELHDALVNRTDYEHCEVRSAVDEALYLQIYYPPGDGPLTVELDANDGTGFHAGPVRDGTEVTLTFEGFEARLTHVLEEQPRTFTSAGMLRRSKFELEMPAKTDAGGQNRRYREDLYTLRITAPAAMTAHVWGDAGGYIVLKVVEPLPTGVTLTDEHLIGAYGGAANVVTVAAYNAEIPSLPLASFSSRGPLVNYEGAGPHPVQKPDIAAPGVSVNAAASREVHPKKKRRKRAVQGAQKHGTSMACPHVAGVVALMLENNPALTSTQIVNILRNHGRTPLEPGETEEELGQGRVDAKLAFDKALTP